MDVDLDTVIDPIRNHLDGERLAAWIESADSNARRDLITYIGEAVFFHKVLADDIRSLSQQSTVLEIGAGVGLLSRLIAVEGHQVIAFEPESAGFPQMGALRSVVSDIWTTPSVQITEHLVPFDPDLLASTPVDLAIAINVLEHVDNPAKMVVEATRSLSAEGRGRFVCPNYAFPYEPHFGFTTLWSKSLTERLRGREIKLSTAVPSPDEFWTDLSWPTFWSLRRQLKAAGVDCSFSRACLQSYVGRLGDPTFLARKDGFGRLAGVLGGPIQIGARLVPLPVAPIIDLTTWRGDS